MPPSSSSPTPHDLFGLLVRGIRAAREVAAGSGLDPDGEPVRSLLHPEIRILIYEAGIRRPLPDLPARRRAARLVRQGGEGTLLVFTDAARTGYVWSWAEEDPATGSQRYREFQLPDHAADLREALSVLPDRPRRLESLPEVVAELARTLRVTPGTGAMRSRLDPLIELVEDTREPAALRRIWRRIQGLAFVDPDCGEGDWLLSVAAHLEPIYVALIDRMRSLVDEREPLRGRRRVDSLGDFRAILSLMGDRAVHPSWTIAIRRRVVRRHLYGCARSRRQAAICCNRLLAHVHRSRAALPQLDVNVRASRCRCTPSAVSFARRSPQPEGASHLMEDLELLGTAWRIVRDLLDRPGAVEAELRNAGRELERRRRELHPRLMKSAPRDGRGDPRPETLRLDFPALPTDGSVRLILRSA
jgi:hypothetical protein